MSSTKPSYASIVANGKTKQVTKPESIKLSEEVIQPVQLVQQRKYPRPKRNYRPVYNSRKLTPYEQKKLNKYCKDNNYRIFCDCCQSWIISDIIKRQFESCGDCFCCDPDSFY